MDDGDLAAEADRQLLGGGVPVDLVGILGLTLGRGLPLVQIVICLLDGGLGLANRKALVNDPLGQIPLDGLIGGAQKSPSVASRQSC